MRLIRVAVLASVVLLGLSTGACAKATRTTSAAPLVIGADLELSGAYATIGTTYERALQLRVDQVNADGGVDGRQLSLEIRDNRSDPTVAVADINAFAADTGVAGVVLGGCRECEEAVGKVIDEKELPVISLAPGGGLAAGPKRRYLFQLGPNPDDSVTVLATLVHSADIKSVALLTTDDTSGDNAHAAVLALKQRSGLTITGEQRFRSTDTDLTQPVRAAVAKNPAALVVSAFPGQAALVAKSARDQGYTGQLLFDAMAAGDLFLKGADATALEKSLMAAPQALVIDDVVATTPAKTARKQWFADYTSKYGGFSGYSTYAADAVRLLTDATHGAGGTARAKLREALENALFDGLSGPVRFTPDNHTRQMASGLSAVVARSGRWRLVG